MEYENLRDFVSQMQAMGEVKVIEGADPHLEIGAIFEIFAGRKDRPLLLYDKIKGFPPGFRIAGHATTTTRRTALAFGIPETLTKPQMIRFWKDKLKTFKPVPPVEVADGPILENVMEGDKINVNIFPVPFWHEQDGGRFLGTGGPSITRDPDDGWINVGTYRVQVMNENILGWHISPGHHGRIMREKYWAKGKSCPVVVVFGPDPRLFLSGTYTLPWGQPELDFWGWLKGSPMKVIKGDYTGLPIPADAEIAIEGESPPPEQESMIEGPFGEWTGYYASGAVREPIIKVKRVLYRNNPIIFADPPRSPALPGGLAFGIPFNAAEIWDKLEAIGVPDVRGVWDHMSGGTGGSALFVVVSIKQRYAGHARQTALAVAGSGIGSYHGRWVVVVDDDIDPSDITQVLWALTTRCDPVQSFNIITDAWSTRLDPMITPDKIAKGDMTNSRALITAVKHFWRKDFPPVSAISKELASKYLDKWADVIGRE
jgi:UbiD family decarboxylase